MNYFIRFAECDLTLVIFYYNANLPAKRFSSISATLAA